MKIAFVADGRSNNFRRWVCHFVERGDNVCVLSTYPCNSIDGVKLYVLSTPIKAGNLLVKSSEPLPKSSVQNKWFISNVIKSIFIKFAFPLWSIWNLLKIANLPFQTIQSKKLLNIIKPDLTIAFRTQNEGYILALAGLHPVVLFTQGSDFIYMANRHLLHAYLTRIAVQRMDALMADCYRDIKLAKHYGLPLDMPTQVLPGNGGVDLSKFKPGIAAEQRKRWVVYPRGYVPYMKLDTFLASIKVLQKLSEYHDVQYTLLASASVVSVMQEMVSKYGLDMDKIDVQTYLPEDQLVNLLQQAAVIVSPSLTDGTPNTMLEAMACGAFPIMSDLESIREWIHHGDNGFVFDPNNVEQLTHCLKLALDNNLLRQRAQKKNLRIVQERADRNLVMPGARQFLLDMIKTKDMVKV